jgi:hypothetical protein
MSEQDYKVKEIFAYYGRTMFLAQAVEKSIMILLIITQHKYKITKTRYDEIVNEKLSLTFGQLKREIKELNCFTESELVMIEEFHLNRDYLTHSYWLERAVEFNDDKLHHKILEELKNFVIFFDNLNELVEDKANSFIEKYNIDLGSILNQMIARGKTISIESFRKLSKNETIIELFRYKNTEKSLIPIFKLLDNTYWTICEIGLTQYKSEISNENKIKFDDLDEIFPIKQFNPRPKVVNPWNYDLDLKKNGLKMIIRRDNEKNQMKWKIENNNINKS